MANVSMHKTNTCGELRNNKQIALFLMAPVVFTVETLVAWQDRLIMRDHLRDVDTRLLSDMGISVEEAKNEAIKPFWMN
ncbi:DUF1127 domain-containing protein [Kiloniella antarctica]|uniref:DUF1127 domain-containing protein n=1 Tax=Kiloniella antarctica TaxID=1550907 RepID=A0ABW5BPD7_9PROT